jgi:hypothetical protein
VKIETAAWSHEAEANSSDAADQVYSFYDGWTRAPGNGSKSDLTAYLGQTPVDSGSTWEVQSSGHKWAIVIAIELKDRTG